MPLNALTITTNSGIVGLPFAAPIGGRSAGTVLSVRPGSAPAFGIVNGVLSTLSLPYEAGAVTVNEYNPATGESRDTTLTLAGNARPSAPANSSQYRLYKRTAIDGTLTWEYGYYQPNGDFVKSGASGPLRYIETIKRIGGSNGENFVSNSPASGQSSVNRTYGQTIAFERKGDEVRVIIHNADVSSAANIEGLSVYATNTEATSVPTGPEVICTFNGVAPTAASPMVLPAGTAGPSGLLADRIFSYVRSDWMPITMLDRTDGGSGFLLHVRIFSSGGLPRVLLPQTFTSSYSTGWLAASGGRSFSTWYGTGDLTHTPAWTGATTTSRQFVAPALAVQVRGNSPILNAGQGFDSQAQGFHAAPGTWTDPTGIEYYGAILAAQKARTSGPLFSAANLGSDGMQGSSGHINMRRWIDALELKVLFMQVWSGNSGYPNIERDKALALETAAYARSKGCIPVFMSAYPRGDSTTSGQNAEQNLLNLNNWIVAQNTHYINAYNQLGNGASPQRLIAASDSGDAIHRSIAGQDIEGAMVLAKAQELATTTGAV